MVAVVAAAVVAAVAVAVVAHSCAWTAEEPATQVSYYTKVYA